MIIRSPETAGAEGRSLKPPRRFRAAFARFQHFSFARFQHDCSGDVAVMFALMAVAMCVFVGAGVDIGRWLHARHQTIAAMDAGVLAGGRELQLDSSNLSGALAAAKQFYAENTKSRLTLVSDTITFTTADNNATFTASGNAYIATPLLAFANIPKLPLLDTSGTEYSKAQIKPDGSGDLEIALMLDVTGSMKGQKIKDMKEAATDLVDIVVAADQSQYKSRLAIVPFSEDVRLPSSANAAARGSPPNKKTVSYSCWWGGTCTQEYKLTPCVVERTGNEKFTDAAPSSGNYATAKYDTNSSCALSDNEEVTPLTSDKNTLKSAIKSLSASGGTAGQIGTAWAWYTLSPNWNGLWSAANQAGAYSNKLQKIAILMTDGEYNTEYDANGIRTGQTGAGSAANGSSTDQARSLCTGIKAKGITVYTVGFDLGGNKTAIDTLSQCATDPDKYYNADNGDELKEAFRDIALKISKLYLTQ